MPEDPLPYSPTTTEKIFVAIAYLAPQIPGFFKKPGICHPISGLHYCV